MKALKDISIPTIEFVCKSGDKLAEKDVKKLKTQKGLFESLQKQGLISKK